MKKAKDRVIALDYFRGLCIIAILLSHAYVMIGPFAYLSGMGRLWASAAEMFFLLSGITLGIVRGKLVGKDFHVLVKKSWHRAVEIYLIYVSVSLAAVLLAITLHNSLFSDTSSASSGLGLFGQIISLQFSSGLAIFLKFYALYMILAPFVMYALYKWRRFWFLPLAVSAGLYILNAPYPHNLLSIGSLNGFITWQLYFVIGLTLARFRLEILQWFYSLGRNTSKLASGAILGMSGLALALSAAIGFNSTPYLERLTSGGWLPAKLGEAYSGIYAYKTNVDLWLMNGRMGLLRPMAAVLFLAAGYLLYQKYKKPILRYSGKFVITMGQNTLWIFVAQALVIPILAALPLPRNLATNVMLSATLFGLMWGIAKRRELLRASKKYGRRAIQALPRPRYSYDYDIE